MLQNGQQYCDAESDSDVTCYSESWSSNRNNDSANNLEWSDSDTPLANRKWKTKINKDDTGIKNISAPKCLPTNSSDLINYTDPVHQSVKDFEESIHILTSVMKLKKAETPDSFVKKSKQYKGDTKLNEELLSEWLSKDNCLQKPKKNHTPPSITFFKNHVNSQHNESSPSVPVNQWRSPALVKLNRRSKQSPITRVTPTASPLATKTKYPAADEHLYQAKGDLSFNIDYPKSNHSVTHSSTKKLPNQMLKVVSLSKKVLDSCSVSKSQKNTECFPRNETDNENSDIVFSAFKKSSLKSTTVSTLKYFKIRRKWRKEQLKRKALQEQINAINITSGLSTFRNNSDVIAKLVSTSSLCPHVIETNKDLNIQSDDILKKIQNCDCPCICSKRNMPQQSNSEINLFLTSITMTPNLNPFLKDNLYCLTEGMSNGHPTSNNSIGPTLGSLKVPDSSSVRSSDNLSDSYASSMISHSSITHHVQHSALEYKQSVTHRTLKNIDKTSQGFSRYYCS